MTIGGASPTLQIWIPALCDIVMITPENANNAYTVCIKRETQTASFCIGSSRCFFTSRQTISYLIFRCTLQDARITHLEK